MEPNSPKKIQFAEPPFESHLDPQAAENIRRRRPTPATLVIYSEPPPEADDRRVSSNPGEVRNATPTAVPPEQNLYSLPTMKELQLVVEQHLQKQEQQGAGSSNSLDPLSPITTQHFSLNTQWAVHNCPEPNGNAGYDGLPHNTEGHTPTDCIEGELSTPESQQENLASPSSVSR